jgi:threonine/homoserine/homoserine lactone efflux protein
MSVAVIFAKGFLVGLAVAVPIGPINIEIIRRGLRSGFREPFALGMGAVTADAIYLALICLGVSRVADYPAVRFGLLTLGFLTLETLGILSLWGVRKIKEVPNGDADSPRAGSLWRVYALGMAMMANPGQIAAWLGLSSVVLGAAAGDPWAYVWFAISVPAGCTSWVIFISTVLHFGRRFVNLTVLRVANIAGGLTLCGFGVYLLWQVLTA